jgi:hypothetical protein
MSKVKYVNNQATLKIWVTCDCPQCDGDGHYESGPECFKPASECCGGCYKTYQCETCSGSGKVMTTLDPETIGEIVDNLLNGYHQEARELIIANSEYDESKT